MPSTFMGLSIAYSGLLNANAGLNATANNIANAETEGYSRQEVKSEAAEALRSFTTYGCIGAGVDTLAIERIHDDFYDQKYWANNTNTGEYNMKEYYMKQIEDYFRDDSTIKGFTSIFNEMSNVLDEVRKNASSSSTKAEFVGYAASLCEYFNSMAADMEQVQKDVNSEIKLKIDEINSLASQIATLNSQINVVELSGGAANELRDKRTLLLDELSSIVSIDVKEYAVTDPNSPGRETGASGFTVRIAGGQILVDCSDYHTMQCVARDSKEKVNQSDIDGLYDVYWVTNSNTGALGDQFNLYNASLGGELEGLIQLRDGNNGENFSGKVTGIGTLNATKHTQEVTITTDSEFLMDLDKCTLSDTGGIIKLGTKEYNYTSWSYKRVTGADGKDKVTYTFTIDTKEDDRDKISSDVNGKDAEVGHCVKYQGVPYYQQQLNEWCRIYANAFNTILSEGYTSDGQSAEKLILYTANYATDTNQHSFDDKYKNEKGEQIDATISSTDDSYYQLTAKNFDIFEVILTDPSLLATKTTADEGSDAYGTIERLMNMAVDKDVASYRGCATQEFLTCVLSDVALNGKQATTFAKNYSNIGKSINNQRISISGVDTDDEAVNLVKYQNAYTLASKVIQTMTEMYDRLILQTGV